MTSKPDGLTLYVYNMDTREVIAEIHGASNNECEETAKNEGFLCDELGWTYTPAFGAVDGLIKR